MKFWISLSYSFIFRCYMLQNPAKGNIAWEVVTILMFL
jgi:hypothetical protein